MNPAHPEVLARDVQAAHLQLALRAAVVRLHAPTAVHQPEVHKQAGAPLHEVCMQQSVFGKAECMMEHQCLASSCMANAVHRGCASNMLSMSHALDRPSPMPFIA